MLSEGGKRKQKLPYSSRHTSGQIACRESMPQSKFFFVHFFHRRFIDHSATVGLEIFKACCISITTFVIGEGGVYPPPDHVIPVDVGAIGYHAECDVTPFK